MTPHMKYGIAGVVIGLILFIISPWLAIAVIAAAVAIPAVLYMMLDPSQRRRLRDQRTRRQIGRKPPPRIVSGGQRRPDQLSSAS